jgi:hypothetical protein
MKPFKLLFLAVALALLAAPIMTPASSGAPAPVISDSEYSAYRAWDTTHWSATTGSYTENPYAADLTRVSTCSVVVDGGLMVDQINGPYPSYILCESTGDFYTTAEYDICWLDMNYAKQTLHVAEANLDSTGGQANNNGHIFKTLVDNEFSSVPEYARNCCWIEDATISLTIHNGVTFDYDKIATWSVSAAFSETIYLMFEYSLGTPEYRLSDPWNHPSATKFDWSSVDWHGLVKYPRGSFYNDSLANDWPRNAAILDAHGADTSINRSALYGYAESLKSRMISIYVWQNLIHPANGTDSLNHAKACISSALTSISTIQVDIATSPMSDIRTSLTDALTAYHLAVLYADRAIIEDVYREPIGDDHTPEEWRALYIELYIDPAIESLEEQPPGLVGWLISSNGLLLTGTAAALGVVAVIWRNGFAAIAAVCALALDLFMWMGGLS